MKITTEKTDYMLVKAGDSRCSGTDFAIIHITDHLLNQIKVAQEAREVLIKNSEGGHILMDCGDCEFAEIEKLNETLFAFIERSTKGENWSVRYIDEELYDAIYETCRLDDIDSPDLRIMGDKLIFQLYTEGGSEGYFLEFCTVYLPINTFQ